MYHKTCLLCCLVITLTTCTMYTGGPKKKSPSKLRRDTKRREAYVAKKNESSATVSIETQDLQKETTATPVPCTSHRISSPSQRFCSFSNKELEGVGDSPIPQLDGGENSLYLDSDDCKTKCTKEDLVKMLKGMIIDMNKIGEDNNDVLEDKTILSNEDDDNFKSVKMWALKQKKST